MMEVKQALVQIRAVLRTEESIVVPRTKKKTAGKVWYGNLGTKEEDKIYKIVKKRGKQETLRRWQL